MNNVGRWKMRVRRDAGYLAVIAICLVTAGCSGDLFGSKPSGSSSPSVGDRFSSLFGNKPASQSQAYVAPTAPPVDFDCPTVTVRQGASTLAVSTPGVDPSAMSLRYQASFAQTSRDCQLVGTNLKMRVGIEGRIILGPAGGPGKIEIPLRIAIVQEGPEPKTIITKLNWVSVNIPPDDANVSFTYIEDDLTFPMPLQVAELNAYVVYVGYDSSASKVPEKKSPPRKPTAKPATPKRPG